MWFSRKVFSWGAGNDPGPVTTSVDGAQFFCISYLFFFVSHIFLYLISFFLPHMFFVSHFFVSHMFFFVSYMFVFCISNLFFISYIFSLFLICFWYLKDFFLYLKLVLGIVFACESLFSSNRNKHILVFAIYIGIILHRRGRCTNLILLRL